MPHSKGDPVEWVSEDHIRQLFNDSGLYRRAQEGELSIHLKRQSHRAPDGEPFCTHSQIVYYFTPEGNLLAVVHQYQRPDGTLGGSGLPDPKRLYLPGKSIAVRSRKR